MNKIYDIEPFPYFRQTQGSKYCLAARRYQANQNALKGVGFKYQPGWGITFVLSMPKSWSIKKRAEMLNKPVTRQRWKDLDNLLKACLDCLEIDDGIINEFGPMRKIWGESGKIIVHQIPNEYWSILESNKENLKCANG